MQKKNLKYTLAQMHGCKISLNQYIYSNTTLNQIKKNCVKREYTSQRPPQGSIETLPI